MDAGELSSESLSVPVGTCVSSPPFRACGRTWQIDLYPNGNRESGGSHISLFLRLTSSRLVNAVFTVVLASIERRSVDYSFTPLSPVRGWSFFVSHADLLTHMLLTRHVSPPGGGGRVTATIRESGSTTVADATRARAPLLLRLAVLTTGVTSVAAARRHARAEQELRSLRSHPRGDGASDGSATAPRFVSTAELTRLSDDLAGGGDVAFFASGDQPKARAALRAAVVLAAAAVVVAGGGDCPPRIAWRLPEAGAGTPSATGEGRQHMPAPWWEEEEDANEEEDGARSAGAETAADFAVASLACVTLWAAGACASLGAFHPPPLLRGFFSCPLLASHPLLQSLAPATSRLLLLYAAMCALPAVRWAAGTFAAALVRAVRAGQGGRRGIAAADTDAAPAVDVFCGGDDGLLRAGGVEWSAIELERLAAAEFVARLGQPCAPTP